jgi:CheY-like chemotaxis protein
MSHIKKGAASSWAGRQPTQGERSSTEAEAAGVPYRPFRREEIFMQKDDEAGAWPNLRVIIIEDEALVVMLLEDMLTQIGCQVVGLASHLDKAVELAGSADADLAILDVNLDGQQAYPVAERLAARGLPFVFATGYGRHGMQHGFGDRPALQKPFRLEDLRRVIAEAMCGAEGGTSRTTR